MNRRRLVRVPASSANLGPGFDSFAAALTLQLELEVEETGNFAVETDLPVPTDKSNLIVQAFERLHSADDFTFRVKSEIPLVGGLGSSASAIVAGLAAADHLFEMDVDLLEHAEAIEGHADNVAAALHGGFVVCASTPVGIEVTKVEPPTGLEALLVIPPQDRSVPTDEARAALPAEIPITDAVHSIAHATMLMLGVTSADWDLLSRALEDRIHQPRRAHLFPDAQSLIEGARDAGALGATLSGAGPTVLVWTTWEQTGSVQEKIRVLVGDSEVRRVNFNPGGLDVSGM